MKIFSYVVALDYGFAPNPFHGICTLATCKPQIRNQASVGDWIVGTGSKPKGYEDRLIFAMYVSEKLTFDEYWSDARYQCKKPNLTGSLKQRFGDNIYHQDKMTGSWIQEDSQHSLQGGKLNLTNLRRDTNSKFVLVGKTFVYYGREAPCIPKTLSKYLCIHTPAHKYKFSASFVEETLNWISGLGGQGFCGEPFDWQENIRRGDIELS